MLPNHPTAALAAFPLPAPSSFTTSSAVCPQNSTLQFFNNNTRRSDTCRICTLPSRVATDRNLSRKKRRGDEFGPGDYGWGESNTFSDLVVVLTKRDRYGYRDKHGNGRSVSLFESFVYSRKLRRIYPQDDSVSDSSHRIYDLGCRYNFSRRERYPDRDSVRR